VEVTILHVARERPGSTPWWNAVTAVHRTYRTSVVAGDRALFDILRVALADDERARLGREWIEHPDDRHEHPQPTRERPT
jgi:hypothetical protein